jgi:hypothetical protein
MTGTCQVQTSCILQSIDVRAIARYRLPSFVQQSLCRTHENSFIADLQPSTSQVSLYNGRLTNQVAPADLTEIVSLP